MKWNIFSVFSTSGGENCQLIFFDFVPTHRLKRSMCRPTPPCDTSLENRRFFENLITISIQPENWWIFSFGNIVKEYVNFVWNMKKYWNFPQHLFHISTTKLNNFRFFVPRFCVCSQASSLLFSQVFLFQFCLDEERGSSSLHASF